MLVLLNFILLLKVSEVENCLKKLQGACFQRPPLISSVKRELRVRTIYDYKL